MAESGKSRRERISAAKSMPDVLLVAAAATKKPAPEAVKKANGKPPKKAKEKGPAFTPPVLNENGWRKNRSAKARDERRKKRGRVPLGYWADGVWNGEKWIGQARVPYASGPLAPMIAWQATGSADGQFRLFEMFDTAFWEWYTHEATAEDRANIAFAKNPTKPEPANKEPADGSV